MRSLERLSMLVLLAFLLACQTQRKIEPPMAIYASEPEEKRSVLHIPIELKISDLEETLNNELQGVLFNDNSFDDGDNMKIKATKLNKIGFKADNTSISFALPLALSIQYNGGIFGTLDATGDISLDLKTEYSIQPDWSIVTKTEISSYRWLRRPTLQMGSINVPIGSLVDLVLNKTRKSIGREIDDVVKDYLGLSRVIQDTWDMMFQPLLVSPEYSAWLQVNPTSIGMTPVGIVNNALSTTIVIEARPLVNIGPRPEDKEAMQLPPLTMYTALAPGMEMYLNTTIAWEEAEKIAKQYVLGETYSSGKRKVTVQDLKLYGTNDSKVVVNTRLTGSYNGSIYLNGSPEYDLSANKIKIKDLDFTLDTKNVLMKGGAWMLRSTIKNRIQDNMNFLLKYNLEEMKNMLQAELNNYRLGSGLRMAGNIDRLEIGKLRLGPNGFNIGIEILGNLKVMVEE
ncbi:MAG TPA: DUF4403 family protein, partial [Haliscomenobacter sp.]|uniref:DUF4403 family protein n=1 Tax=Haliscomenobacter sp. TaxID=2717303 RepID=UPI002C8858C5